MAKYVNSDNLAYYNNKIKALLNGKSNTNHTHNYAGSSSAGGAANSAVKLATARYIFGNSFDGSGNVVGKGRFYGTYTSTASDRCFNGGLEIRENGLVENTQSDIGYAPTIGFHWAGRISAALFFHNDGNFYFRKGDGTSRATIDANVNGNASTASKWATARTLSLTGSVTGSGSIDGSGNVSIATTTNHSHNYAGSSSAGGSANSVANSLTVQFNGTTKATFNGSAAKTVNITPSGIGAAESSHTHKYAGSSSAGGAATNVYETLTNPSNATTYYIPFNTNASTGSKSLLLNDGLQYYTKEGTTSADGEAQLGLGNNIASGTAKNKRGKIYMYGTSSGFTSIVPGYNSTESITITLPSSNGTLALDGHTHTYSSLTGLPTLGTAASENTSTASSINNSVAYIDKNGVMEVGRYIDMHYSNNDGYDYTGRIGLFNANGRVEIKTRNDTTPLVLTGYSASIDESWLQFNSSKSGTLGWIGYDSVSGPIMRYTASGSKYRVHDASSITYGTSAPTGTATNGDIYIQYTA